MQEDRSGEMKIDITSDEAKLILNRRAWDRLFGKKNRAWIYYVVMSPIVIVVFSTALLFIPNINEIVPSVFLAFGLLCLPLTFKALKKFKALQVQIQNEMIKEEKGA